MKRTIQVWLFTFIAFTPFQSVFCQDKSKSQFGVPSMIDFDWSNFDEIKTHLGMKEGFVHDNIAQRLIDFNYVLQSGTGAAFFQTTFGTDHIHTDNRHDPLNGVDDAFRVWGSDAEKAGLNVGCYHFFHPIASESPEKQADLFLEYIVYICFQHAKDFRGKKIMLAFDAANDELPSKEVDDIWRFAHEIHSKTNIWPGFYPETGDLNSDTYRNAFSNIDGPEFKSAVGPKKAELKQCWLWLAKYDPKPFNIAKYSSDNPGHSNMRSYLDVWPNILFWQYTASEKWPIDGKKGPLATAYDPVNFYPIPPAGSVIPLDCSYLNENVTLQDIWNKDGWIAWPRPVPDPLEIEAVPKQPAYLTIPKP